jgi:predicted CopG family antitoxin
MATKTITLDRDAYELLKKQKASGESFSDVVKRLAQTRRPLSAYAGIWKGLSRSELRKIEQAIERGRGLDQRRMAGLLHKLR